ncbi:MAG: aldo/keto reductase [Lactovum sp.]
MKKIKLNNGEVIPQFGLGVYQIEGDENTKKACLEAFKNGYRHIDTAHAYQNERGVGQALKESSLKREEVFITSKLWPSDYGKDLTLKAIDKMLDRLQVEYIDLLLLHQQFGHYIEAYEEMEKAVELGKVKSIGLSNFESERLEEILEKVRIKPQILQVECHPYYSQEKLKERVKAYGTVIESWYPIGHADEGLLNEELFTSLAQKYGKTNVQIILRWHIQKGHILFPKSTNPIHIKENIDIFDFKLTEEEMKKINALDKNQRFFNMSLEEQEQLLSAFIPED